MAAPIAGAVNPPADLFTLAVKRLESLPPNPNVPSVKRWHNSDSNR